MKFFKALGDAVRETRLNPNTGTWAYYLHRITGIGLAIYLFLHIVELSSAQKGPAAFDARISSLSTPFFHILEVGLIAFVFYHMLNGLRVTVADFLGLTREHRIFFWAGMLLLFVIVVYTLVLFLPRIIHQL